MSTENGRNGFIEEIQKDLCVRAWVSYIFSFVYLVLTAALICFAYTEIYFDATIRAVDDVKKVKQLMLPDEVRDIRFYDAATNPDDGTVIAVGGDSSILVLSKDGEVKHDFKGVGGTKSDLRSVAFSGDGKIAIVAGDDGTILVSTDRGKSWRAAESITDKDFIRVALNKKGDIAIAVGDRGLIRISDNYGRTWSRPGMSNVTSKHINDIVLSDDGATAIAVADDEVILLSNDGGKTWDVLSYGEGQLDFQAVALHEDKTAMVVGDDGSILISCDKGENFHPRKSGDQKTDRRSDFYDIAISGDGKIAIAVGRKGVVWTLNLAESGWCLGKGWTKRESKVGESLESVALNHDGFTAIAVGRDGTILISEDRGETWKSRNSGTASDFYKVTLGLDGMSAVVVGKESTILWLESPNENSILDRVTPLSVELRLTESASQKSDGEEEDKDKSTSHEKEDGIDFSDLAIFSSLFDRTGTVLLLLFVVPYLMILTRYHIRLAAFYNGRRDAIRLAPTEAFPHPENVDELKQMMYALSPDGLDFGRLPKSVIDLVMRTFRQDGKNSNTDK